MKKVFLFICLVVVAGCSKQKLIDCNMERQNLRVENDVLNQQIVDAQEMAAMQKAEWSQKLLQAESKLAEMKKSAAEMKIIIDQKVPELEKAYNDVKEQLQAANEAVRTELQKNIESKKQIKQLVQQVEQLKNAVEGKDKLLIEANEKLKQLADAIKVMEKEKASPEPAEKTE